MPTFTNQALGHSPIQEAARGDGLAALANWPDTHGCLDKQASEGGWVTSQLPSTALLPPFSAGK
jgi:hypothetical protein